MPKMKTKRSLAKRVKKTGSGKIVFFKTGRRHKLTKKTRTRKRRLCETWSVAATDQRAVKRMLCMG
ncbi:50S ribosomal protein L35 [bacterium]|nr:50S ribosomal protein L35 [bacterium]MBU1636888.1 50S ribosomal protein L35 [bacterium]